MSTPEQRNALRKAIRQGVRQSQQPGGELEDATPLKTKPADAAPLSANPLAYALQLLRDAGGDEYHRAALALEEYVNQMRSAMYHQHKTTAQPGQTLTQADPDRPTVKGEHAMELLNRVCHRLSNHFGGDPAVTWENAPGLVTHLIEQVDEVFTDNQKLATECAQMREARELQDAPALDETESDLRQLISDFCGGWVADPVAAVREQLDKLRESELRRADMFRRLSDLSELHGGQMGHEEPLIELQRILIQLEANQKPAGFEAHLQTVLAELDRYRQTLLSVGLMVKVSGAADENQKGGV